MMCRFSCRSRRWLGSRSSSLEELHIRKTWHRLALVCFLYRHIISHNPRAPKSGANVLCSLTGMKDGVQLGKPFLWIFLPICCKTSIGLRSCWLLTSCCPHLWLCVMVAQGAFKTPTTRSSCQPRWNWSGCALYVGIFTGSAGGSNEQLRLCGRALEAGTLLLARKERALGSLKDWESPGVKASTPLDAGGCLVRPLTANKHQGASTQRRTAWRSLEFFSWNVSISVWGSYSVIKELFLQPYAWLFSLPNPWFDIL